VQVDDGLAGAVTVDVAVRDIADDDVGALADGATLVLMLGPVPGAGPDSAPGESSRSITYSATDAARTTTTAAAVINRFVVAIDVDSKY
jgi:hypothetical protein